MEPLPVTDVFEFSLTVRYMEVDAQGVVFNAWYLTYFDEAFTAFLQSRGLGYQALIGEGLDFQLVHADIDWKAGLRFRDNAVITVSTARLGRTSFAIDFLASRDGAELACSARIVYVVVATDGSGKRDLSPEIAGALGVPAPLRPLLAREGPEAVAAYAPASREFSRQCEERSLSRHRPR